MSSQVIVENTGQQAHITTDTSKIFLWNNRYDKESYVNNSFYNPIILPAGTVMGRVAATRRLVPYQGGASDGSQFPIGVLADDYTVDSGENIQVSLCISGDVNENELSWYYIGTGLDNVVSSRTVRDWLLLSGINLVSATEMSAPDNS